MRRAPVILTLALVAVCVGLVIWTASRGGDPATDPAASGQPSTPSATPASSTPTNTAPAYRDGIYLVGSEIQPGTYTATAGDRPCYWARLRSFGDGARSIIDQANLEPGETARVTVEPGDRGFKAANGCVWRLEQAA